MTAVADRVAMIAAEVAVTTMALLLWLVLNPEVAIAAVQELSSVAVF